MTNIFSFSALRQIFKFSMMRPAYAVRIIKTIRVLRNVLKFIMVSCRLAFKGPFASYFFLVFLIVSLMGGMLPSYIFPVFLVGMVKENRDSSVSEKKSKKKHYGKSDKRSERTKIKGAVENEKDCLLQLLYPSINKIERFKKEGIDVAVYIRVSTTRQAREGKSLEAQEAEAKL